LFLSELLKQQEGVFKLLVARIQEYNKCWWIDKSSNEYAATKTNTLLINRHDQQHLTISLMADSDPFEEAISECISPSSNTTGMV